MQCSRGSFILG